MKLAIIVGILILSIFLVGAESSVIIGENNNNGVSVGVKPISSGGNGTTINNYITNGSVFGTGENGQFTFWNDTLNNRTIRGSDKFTVQLSNTVAGLNVGNVTFGQTKILAGNIFGSRFNNLIFANESGFNILNIGYASGAPQTITFAVGDNNGNYNAVFTSNITGLNIFGKNLCYSNGTGCQNIPIFNLTYDIWAYNQSINILPLNNIFAGNNSFQGLNTNFQRINASQINVSGRIDIVSPVNSVGNLFIKRNDRYLATIGDAGDGLTSALRMYGNGTASQYLGEVSISDVSIANYPSENRVLGILARKMGTNSYKLAYTQRVGVNLKTTLEFDTNGFIYIGASDWSPAKARLDVDGNSTFRGDSYFLSDLNVTGLLTAPTLSSTTIYNNIIADPFGSYVLDSTNHILKDLVQGDDAINFYDTNAIMLSYYTTDGILRTTGNNGTLIVDTNSYADVNLSNNFSAGYNYFANISSSQGISTDNNEYLMHDVIRHTITADDVNSNEFNVTWSKTTRSKIVSMTAVLRDAGDSYVAAQDWTLYQDTALRYTGTTIFGYAQGAGAFQTNDIVTIYIVYEK